MQSGPPLTQQKVYSLFSRKTHYMFEETLSKSQSKKGMNNVGEEVEEDGKGKWEQSRA